MTHPQRYCDLVMKGGITSGIVYPAALLELAKEYRFRHIGGASAGAIAGAAAAAAEYARASGRTGGFDRLAEMLDSLCQEGRLLALFTPPPATTPVLLLALDLLKRRKALNVWMIVRAIWTVLRRELPGEWQRATRTGRWIGALAGLVLALALALVFAGAAALLPGPDLQQLPDQFALAALAPMLAMVLLLGGLGHVLIGTALAGRRAALLLHRQLCNEQCFGLVRGSQGDDPPDHDPLKAGGSPRYLTDWLEAELQRLSGIDSGETLTFSALEAKGIDLQLVTTDLSQGMPALLPFNQNSYIFNEAEFRQLFPAHVVNHLIGNAYRSRSVILPAGYHFLPPAGRLPVIVGVRMSLSFPLLISAVPLYSVPPRLYAKRRSMPPPRPLMKLRPEQLRRHVFSDGGISSNFPIHFFDSFLPEHPTFGIDLAYGARKDAKPVLGDVSRFAELDHHPVRSLADFLLQIWHTAHEHKDRGHKNLPSYRERIVTVPLADGEGGLNLEMDVAAIKAVADKGRLAGKAVLEQFDMAKHRWVRFRVIMAELEAKLIAMENVLAEVDKEQGIFHQVTAYRLSNKKVARAWLRQLRGLIAVWRAHDVMIYRVRVPRPGVELRTAPRL